jgi:NAD(P)-dependent dehydrogenase (short-subunit alcohol dehydrogenase family)
MLFDLSNKKALVTGASRGIGKGIALALAEQGADIAVNYHSSKEKADKVVEEIKNMGRDAFAVQADVSDSEAVEKMFAKIKQEWNGLDILVNNAGIVNFKPFEQMTEKDWDKVIDVNLKGQFLCAKAAVPLLEKQDKPRIINLASIASGGVGVGFMNLAHYCASKGGVVAMTEELALELGPKNINVNVIAPGVIDTDMTESFKNDPERLKGTLARIPKNRMGKPEEIGAMAAFLASDEADYCTGAAFYVDGGWLAN